MGLMLALLAQSAPVTAEDHSGTVGFYGAATAILVIVTTILQSWYQDHRAAKQAEAQEKAAKAAKEAAEASANASQSNSKKLDAVLNGEGIGGTLKKLADWQITHDKENAQRFNEADSRMNKIELSVSQIHRLKLEELLKIEKLRRERDHGTRESDPPHPPETN